MKNVRPAAAVALAGGLIIHMGLAGCRKGAEPTWDIDLLAPIARTTFTLRDLLADSLLRTDPDGSVVLVYNGTLFDVDLDTVLTAPDTAFFYRYGLPYPGPIDFPAGVNLINQSDVQRFDLDELALRQLVLREGRLELRMKNMVATRILGSIEIPAAQFPNGISAIHAVAEAGSPSHPVLSTAVRDLAGTRFDLRGPQGNSVNTLLTSVSAQLDPDGQGASVTDQDSLIIEALYAGLVPEYAKGYFGQRSVAAGPTEEGLGLFDAVVGGTLGLDHATLRLELENGFGADMRLRMHELTAINTRTGAEVSLEHALFNGPLNLTRALDLGNGPQPTRTERVLDAGNSNLVQFIEALPDRVRYRLGLEINPLGDVSNGNDFLYHSSQLKAGISLEVPLRLMADELTLQGILEPDLPGSAAGHALRHGILRLFAANGFPLSARLILDLINDNGEAVASIPVQGTVAPAPLGPDGLAGHPVDSRLEAALDETLVDRLYAGNRLRVRVAFSTAGQPQRLRLLDRYAMHLQMTMEANYMVNGDE